MGIKGIALAVFALAGAPAFAQSSPYDAMTRDWRLLGVAPDYALFIDAGAARDGDGVELSILAVYAQAQEAIGNPFDNQLQTLRANCTDRTFAMTGVYMRTGNENAPPAVIMITPNPAPPANSGLDLAIATACGQLAWSDDRVADPYRSAREILQRQAELAPE